MSETGGGVLGDLSSDEAMELAMLAVAGRMAKTPVKDQPRFVLELSKIMVESLTKTIDDLRRENEALKAEVDRLRGT